MGGKRLRPLLLCLAARACGYTGPHHHSLAAIVEFIHTATLLHDDVVDESDTRRGRDTAHAVWGNSAAVLVGDFLYSRSFQMMVTLDDMRIMDILADTTNTIAEGEVLQLLNLGDPEVSEEAYLRVIDNKTAKLFEAAGRLAAVVANRDSATQTALATYGSRLGRAFQIADDLLDYAGDASTLGKNVGDDLAEGKPTLPLIIARERATDKERALLDRAISEGGHDQLDAVLDIIRRTGALATTAERARIEARESTRSAGGPPGQPLSRRPGPRSRSTATSAPPEAPRLVAASGRSRRQGQVPFLDTGGLLRENVIDPLDRHLDDVVARTDGIDHGLVFFTQHFAEDRVFAIQPRRGDMGDEKLAAVGSRPRIGHGQLARRVVTGGRRALVLEGDSRGRRCRNRGGSRPGS